MEVYPLTIPSIPFDVTNKIMMTPWVFTEIPVMQKEVDESMDKLWQIQNEQLVYVINDTSIPLSHLIYDISKSHWKVFERFFERHNDTMARLAAMYKVHRAIITEGAFEVPTDIGSFICVHKKYSEFFFPPITYAILKSSDIYPIWAPYSNGTWSPWGRGHPTVNYYGFVWS